MKLFFSDRFKDDLDEILFFIAQDNPEAANRFADKIFTTCITLLTSPEIGKPCSHLADKLLFFPYKKYLIFYEVSENVLNLVRVLSGYRDIPQIFSEEE